MQKQAVHIELRSKNKIEKKSVSSCKSNFDLNSEILLAYRKSYAVFLMTLVSRKEHYSRIFGLTEVKSGYRKV